MDPSVGQNNFLKNAFSEGIIFDKIKLKNSPKVAVEFETNVEDLDSEAGSDF